MRTFLRVSRRLRRSLGTAGVLSSASTSFVLVRGWRRGAAAPLVSTLSARLRLRLLRRCPS